MQAFGGYMLHLYKLNKDVQTVKHGRTSFLHIAYQKNSDDNHYDGACHLATMATLSARTMSNTLQWYLSIGTVTQSSTLTEVVD